MVKTGLDSLQPSVTATEL